MNAKTKALGFTVIAVVALAILLSFIRGCQKQQEERVKTTLYSPPNVVSGSVIAFPERWTMVPLTECKAFVIVPKEKTVHYMQRVNGWEISGPFTADTIPADNGVRSVEVRSMERYPIEIAYSMIK